MPNPDELRLPEELLVVGAAVKIGLFDALNEAPSALAELARAVGADTRALERVVEALGQSGYVDVKDGFVSLTTAAKRMFFEPEHEEYAGYACMHAYARLKTWLTLPEVIKTGTAPPKERTPERLRHFMDAMRHYARQVAPAVVDLCLEDTLPPRLLDLGGGPLNYAVPFAERGVSVTVQDVPEVVERMRPLIPAGLDIRMVPGDFHESVSPGPYEAAFLGNVTHIYGPDENRELFRRIADVLTPGGRIIIVDYVRGLSPRAPYMGVNMLVSSASGGVWTLDEYTAWLAAGGFGPPAVKTLDERQVLVARLAR
ncbi:MAG: methyltransferase domain-containing protein [Candidatus Desulforudis sp.]|nr:methyltransferase domain-containing protein [Desulforudis sp.]